MDTLKPCSWKSVGAVCDADIPQHSWGALFQQDLNWLFCILKWVFLTSSRVKESALNNFLLHGYYFNTVAGKDEHKLPVSFRAFIQFYFGCWPQCLKLAGSSETCALRIHWFILKSGPLSIPLTVLTLTSHIWTASHSWKKLWFSRFCLLGCSGREESWNHLLRRIPGVSPAWASCWDPAWKLESKNNF